MNSTRDIYIEGDALLPPSPVPVPPADMQPGEVIMVHPPGPILRHGESDYFYFRDDNRLPAEFFQNGADWVNEPHAPPHPGYGLGFARCESPAVYRLRPRAKRYPDAMGTVGRQFLMMSQRLVDLLRDAVGDAIEVLPLRIERPDGTLHRDDYAFVDVVRKVEAVDWANSLVQYSRDHKGSAGAPHVDSMRTLQSIPSNALLFRDMIGRYALVHRSLVERIEKLRPKITGFNFETVTRLDWQRVERDKQKMGASA